MIKQMFFVVKTMDRANEGNFFQQVSSVLEICGTTYEKVSFEVNSDRSFFYALLSLKEEISLDKAQKVKDAVLAGTFDFDIFFSQDFPCFDETDTRPGALVMDMDMTSVQIEGIDEIARRMGVYEKVAAITNEAMNGKLEFAESLQRRVACLKGGDAQAILAEIKESMPETEGLAHILTFCNTIKPSHNFQTCIASGGFHELISVIDEKYGLNKICANHLGIDEAGKFTGEVVGDIVDGVAKAKLVQELKASGIPQERIIVVGDGANDLPMLNEGGVAIAFHAKPKVQERTLNVLNRGDLSALFYLLYLRTRLYA